ncbi:MAG: histidinol-phosphatase [Rhodospirillaceae bacterium]|nr:histidinol-phosphatase [Rhodospirillaceae bacterium]
MTAPCPAELVAFGERLADAAGEIVRRYYRRPVQVDDKPDSSPVTIADRETEAAMRRLIAETYPAHGIIGEEHGAQRPDADHVWVIDPIDGTRSFVAGRPLFGTLLALVRDGRPILGIIDQPILRERWVGAAGRATTCNGVAVRVRPCPGLADALLSTTSPHMFLGGRAAAWERVRRRCRMVVYGGDCYQYGLVASGCIDLVVEATLHVHDFMPLVPVIEGAGGVVSDWNGAPLSLSSGDAILAAGDRRTHAAALAALAGQD